MPPGRLGEVGGKNGWAQVRIWRLRRPSRGFPSKQHHFRRKRCWDGSHAETLTMSGPFQKDAQVNIGALLSSSEAVASQPSCLPVPAGPMCRRHDSGRTASGHLSTVRRRVSPAYVNGRLHRRRACIHVRNWRLPRWGVLLSSRQFLLLLPTS